MARVKKEKDKTHIQVDREDKETLETLRDIEGYASIAVTLKKMIAKCLKKTNQVA